MDECAGNPRNAMVLAQVTYWLQPSQKDGSRRSKHIAERGGYLWLYMTDAEFAAETHLHAEQVRRARFELRKAKILDYKAAFVGGQKVTLIKRHDAEPIEANDEETSESTNGRNRGEETSESTNGKRRNRRHQTSESTEPTSYIEIEEDCPPSSGDDGRSDDTRTPVEKRRAEAKEIVDAWWLERKAADHPPAQSFIAVRKVVEGCLANGVARKRIEWALRNSPTVSAGAFEMAINNELSRRNGRSKPDQQTDAIRRVHDQLLAEEADHDAR